MTLRTLKSTVRTLPTSTLRTAAGSWRDGRTTAERGYGGRWQKARAVFLDRNPLCIFCARNGRVEVANVVDHVIPHEGDQKLFWDRSNWQSLCKPCHDSTKRLMENDKTARHRVGIDGWPEGVSYQQGTAHKITAEYLRERGLDPGGPGHG